MTFRIILFTLLLFITAASSSAKIYKYRDANGVLRFTDNLHEVPQGQREKVQSYHEIIPNKETELRPVQKDTANERQSEMDREAEALKKEKELLDAEYTKLEEDRKALVEMSQKDKKLIDDAELRENIERFNIRIKAYDEKLKTFEEKVSQYNAKVK